MWGLCLIEMGVKAAGPASFSFTFNSSAMPLYGRNGGQRHSNKNVQKNVCFSEYVKTPTLVGAQLSQTNMTGVRLYGTVSQLKTQKLFLVLTFLRQLIGTPHILPPSTLQGMQGGSYAPAYPPPPRMHRDAEEMRSYAWPRHHQLSITGWQFPASRGGAV